MTGVEISPEAAKVAQSRADRVIVGDAEQLDYEALLGEEQFDCILFADVLEHLRDPGSLLTAVKPFLSSDGAVIASIPNIAHGSVRLALLAGEFRYRPSGLLDESHIRFFTRDSIQDLVERAGYLITNWIRQQLAIEDSEVAVPTLPNGNGLAELLTADFEATTYQFIVRAVPATVDNRISLLREELKAMAVDKRAREEELRIKELEHARTLDELTEMRQLLRDKDDELRSRNEQVGALEELQERETELRGLLLDAQDQLLEAHDELFARGEELHGLAGADEERIWLRGVVKDRDAEIADLEQQLRELQATRLWRVGTRWWKFKATLTGKRGLT